MKKFFTPEDFVNDGEEHWQKPCVIKPEIAANRANEKIEREAKVLCGELDFNADCWTKNNHKDDTHQALLINIQPIEKPCEHPESKLSSGYITQTDADRLPKHIVKCECGMRLQATKFEPVESEKGK